MTQYNLVLKNNDKVALDVVVDCLSIINNDVANKSRTIAIDAHSNGKSIILTGSKKTCQNEINKLKKYIKFKINPEYDTVITHCLKIEDSQPESIEISNFKKQMTEQKEQLIKYIHTLGITSFSIYEYRFDKINKSSVYDVADINFKKLEKNSEYSADEIQKRIIELNKSQILSILYEL